MRQTAVATYKNKSRIRKAIKLAGWLFGLLLSIPLIYLFTGDIIFNVILLSIGLILLPPISRKLFDNKKEGERTLFGKIAEYSFIGFNICSVIWIIYMIIILLVRIQSPISQGTLESASFGIPILIITVVLIWLSGNFILGLLTLEEKNGFEHGYITKELIKAQIQNKNSYFYLCGPPPMMNAVINHLKELGIDDDRVVKEQF